MRQTFTSAELRERFPKPIFPIPTTHFYPQEVIPLSDSCGCMGICYSDSTAHATLLIGTGKDLQGRPLTQTGASASQPPAQEWRLDAPVQEIIDSAGGAIAITDTALYQILHEKPPKLIVRFTEPIRMAGGHHRWIFVQSVITPGNFWLVDSTGVVPSAPRLFTVDVPGEDLQSIALSDRCFLVSNVSGKKTHLRLMNRWGKSIWHLDIQTPLHQLIPSRRRYQFLAQGGLRGEDLLVIDLKPFRIMRCRLDITADWLGELIIGFVGISAAGKLRIVNFQGQTIGQVDHLPPPTEIAFYPPYHIWLTTNQGDFPSLHCIDIRKLDLEIVF